MTAKNTEFNIIKKLYIDGDLDTILNNLLTYDLSNGILDMIILFSKNADYKKIVFARSVAEKLIDSGHVFKSSECKIMLKIMNFNMTWQTKETIQSFKNFKFDTFDSLIAFLIENDFEDKYGHRIDHGDMKYNHLYDHFNLQYYGDVETLIEYMNCVFSWIPADFTHLNINENHLKYANMNSVCKQYINEVYTINNIFNKINTKMTKKDRCIIGAQSIDYVAHMIGSLDYNISALTIVFALQNNTNYNIIEHLFSYKLNIDENQLCDIISCLRNYNDCDKVVFLLKKHNFIFTQKHYKIMMFCNNFDKIFTTDLNFEDFVISDEITSLFLMYIKNKDAYEPSKNLQNKIHDFLENIEHLGLQNKTNASNILMLYCGLRYVLSSQKTDKKIAELRKKYNMKLSNEHLSCVFANKQNLGKKIIDMFIEDAVVPSSEQIITYIKNIFAGNYCDHLMLLLNK